MNLERANTYLSLLANFGVILGIIFLVVQIQQNTSAVHASTAQALEQGVSDVMAPWTSDVETAALLFRGRDNFEDLNAEEQLFVGLLIRRLYLHMDSFYWAYRSDALPPELWEREMGVLAGWVNSPGGRVVWDQGGFSKPFSEFVEENLIREVESRNDA